MRRLKDQSETGLSVISTVSTESAPQAQSSGSGLDGASTSSGALSIRARLFILAGANALIILVLIGLIVFGIQTTDAVRGYIHGEGLWSKGQKSAVFHLSRYTLTRDPADFQRFRDGLEVTLAYRQARLEMEKADFDYSIIEDGWVRGGNLAAEVPQLFDFYRNFRRTPQLQKAIQIWEDGDVLIEELSVLGREIQTLVATRPLTAELQRQLLSRIDELNDRLTPLEVEFSATLRDAARWAHQVLVTVIASLALALLALALWLSVSIARNIQSGINELRFASRRMELGILDRPIDHIRKDELGELARVFNQMMRRRQEAKIQLEAHAADLEIANRELSASNDELRRLHRAEAANEAKTRFVATISHELRTPLHGLLGLLETFETNGLSKKQAHRLELMRESGAQLKGLIGDVLDMAKIESGRVDLDYGAYAPAEIAPAAIHAVEVQAQRRGIPITLHQDVALPELLHGDPLRLRQVLINLLSNAIKFTPRGGSVHVSVRASSHSRHGPVLRFDVRDSGVGLTPEALEHIFEHVPPAIAPVDGEHSGAGLGLAISKGLVDAMGGSIHCESQADIGSTFWFEVPAEPAKGNAGSHAPMASGPLELLRPLRLLVVEDIDSNQLVIRDQLARYNCEVTMASDAASALKLWAPASFDILISDIQLNGLSGLDLARKIRDLEGPNRRAVIIGLTASADPDIRQRCQDAGMDDCLIKPLSLAQLDAALRRWTPQLLNAA